MSVVSDNIIVFPGGLNPRAGGPSGYLSILKSGLEGTNSKTKVIYNQTNIEQNPIKRFLHNSDLSIVQRFRKWNRKRLEKRHSTIESINSYYGSIIEEANKPFDGVFLNAITDPTVKTVHVHTVLDACRLKATLDKAGLDRKIILTAHTPESYAIETINALDVKGMSSERKQELFDLLCQIEIKALTVADYLIFPSQEAMEPLSDTVQGFDKIICDKPIFFVPTGSISLYSDMREIDARAQYGIKDDEFAISFIGRHISVKGYDILKEAAKVLESKHPKLRFFIAGKPLNLDEGLHAPYWNELGYIDPRQLLKASDCFVLPNRRTFYDLVLLEALSVGVPIIVSKTGGNKSVQAKCSSLFGFECDDSAVENLVYEIERMISLSKEERIAISQRNRKYYLENHTPEVFAKNYETVIDTILHGLADPNNQVDIHGHPIETSTASNSK